MLINYENTTNLLEKVAVNAVLPLRAAQHDVIANDIFLGPHDTSDLISVVSFTIVLQHYLMQLAP